MAAFLVSFIFTPVMRLIAVNYGIVDPPIPSENFTKLPSPIWAALPSSWGWVAGLALSQIHLVAPDLRVSAPHLRVKLSIVAGRRRSSSPSGCGTISGTSGRVYKIMGQVIAALLLLLTQGHVGSAHCLGSRDFTPSTNKSALQAI
jgi:UDP-GlcNAc:undecaprenyl-phosphate/decaprenyl-phosphate GlcNAc-1-phosphate transferase